MLQNDRLMSVTALKLLSVIIDSNMHGLRIYEWLVGVNMSAKL